MDNNTIDFKDKQNNFRELLNDHRKEKKLTDVELKVGDKLFPAHRAVLSVSSPVLNAAFSENWTSSKIYPISEEHVEVESMEDLLNFLYTGSIKLTPDNLHPVCMAAHFLQIRSLLQASVKQLCKQITVANVLPLFLFSTNRELTVLQNACLIFITDNHEKVFQDSQILEFSVKDFKDLIIGLKDQFFSNFEALRVNTFDCVVRWTEQEPSDRLDELPVLLKSIPIEELSNEFLTNTVSVHPLVKESYPCIEVLDKAFRSFTGASIFQPDLAVISTKKIGNNDRFNTNIITTLNFYDSQRRVLKEVPTPIKKRAHFSTAVINQRDIVICGGYVYDTHCFTTSVDMFHGATQTWTKLPDMPKKLGAPLIAEHKGKLYVAGGKHHENSSGSLLLVHCYSFETEQWQDVKSMNMIRSYGSLISHGDYLYAIGGRTGIVERYDPELGEWTVMDSMKHCDRGTVVGATVHQGKIYACGFFNEQVGFQVYDLEQNVWTLLPQPGCKNLPSLVSLNGKLLAIGCRDNPSSSSSSSDSSSDSSSSDSSSDDNQYSTILRSFIYEFDLSSQQWSEFCKMPSDVSWCQLSALVGAFY